MFDLNPLNLPDAPMQHVVMLLVAVILGFIIGFISQRQTIRQLEVEHDRIEADIIDWQNRPVRVANTSDDEETNTLNRIAIRAQALNFDRIGRAAPTDADDLKKISGVGPFLEKKLNTIGIYTFAQIARFSPEDEDLVNDIIEFFPGRIARDRWVSQAAELAKK
jgi:predicted flap endonuclease-1-like 5' DNA nuclease